jgi:ABC-type polysaccharide/polyol phosphate transport system ATPase subunit
LGFAVASDVEPEILIIDEVLSVGDEAFQQKCLARMQSFRAKNTTILFVSHALDAIEKLCDRAIWIDQGQLRHSGAVGQTIQAYLLSL